MKTLATTLILILAATFTANAASFFAPQDTIDEKKSIVGAFENDFQLSEFNDFDENDANKVFVRQPKELPATFSGYKIELLRVYNQPLSADDELLKNTGGVEVEKIGENTYAYLIGNFNTKEGMLNFLNTVIAPKPEYKNAKALVYKKGVRVKEIKN